jgi:hypothetical protein
MKAYKAKSSAIRAAKKEFGEDYLEQSELHEDENGFYFAPKKAEVVAIKKDTAHLRGSSSISSPCLVVWNIAGEMLADWNNGVEGAVKPRRKDIIAKCVEEGVAFYTARTQYQKYLEACRG